MSPTALDLYCGGGGAGRGLADAGFTVTGVDLDPQPHYPFTFVQTDATTLDPEWIAAFDFVWASPPCQFASRLGALWPDRHHPNLIPPTRRLLDTAGRPYAMENVPEAARHPDGLRADVLLCGKMFGLPLLRHRVVECSGFAPPLLLHPPHTGRAYEVNGHSGSNPPARRPHAHPKGTLAEWREAMGIDWLPQSRLVQAVPPAYSHAIAAAVTLRTRTPG